MARRDLQICKTRVSPPELLDGLLVPDGLGRLQGGSALVCKVCAHLGQRPTGLSEQPQCSEAEAGCDCPGVCFSFPPLKASSELGCVCLSRFSDINSIMGGDQSSGKDDTAEAQEYPDSGGGGDVRKRGQQRPHGAGDS